MLVLVHSLMLSIHFDLGLPCFRFPFMYPSFTFTDGVAKCATASTDVAKPAENAKKSLEILVLYR